MKKILLILLLLPCFASAQIETYLVSPYGNIEFDSARVMTIDSGIVYVTPTMLSDSLATVGGGTDTNAITTNTPMTTTLDTVQRNGVNSALHLSTIAVKLLSNGIGGTAPYSNGLHMVNYSPATGSALANQQVSPGLLLEGQGWATFSGSSKSVQFSIYTSPRSGVTDPIGNLIFGSYINGAYIKNPMFLSHLGQLTVDSSLTVTDGTIDIAGTQSINVGSYHGIHNDAGFTSTGASDWKGYWMSGTITQSGGGSGITRGIYLNPVVTTAADYRAIETTNSIGKSIVTGSAPSTFGGTITFPTPFTLGATSVTSTGTQLNYLSSATGTTGTTSTNLVFSTSPTLVTPNLGTPSTLVGTNITGTASGLTSGITNALKSATTTVNVSSATAPTSGQVLTATSSTTATWQTSSGIPPQLEYNNTDKTVWCNGKLDYATNTNFGESTITQLSGFAFHNSAFGYTTMYGNTSGSYNTAFGSQSLYSNSTSLYNSAFGQTALYSATGGYNTAVGGSALYSIGAGIRNSGLGFQALNSVVGNYNVALGSNAGQNHSGGSMNLADNSIFIGYNAKAFANNQINQIVIGHDAVGLGSNTTVIGNNSTVNAKIWGALATGSINTGTTLNGTIFAKSANVLSLASTDHALTAGNESTGLNMAFGLYSTSLGIQARNNGTSANLFLQPLGGGVSIGDGSLTGNRAFAVNNTGAGTGDYASIEIRNGSAGTDALRLYTTGTGFTPSGSNGQDAVAITSGTGLSGGMSIGTLANATFRVFSNNTERWVLDGSGNTIITGKFTSSGGGLGYSTGAGGTVTQLTSKSTGVTLNKLSGQITMNNASLAANGEAVFTLTNSFIEATDVVVVSLANSVSAGRYMVGVATTSAGSCQIIITNLSSVASEAPVINFAVIKAVNN